MARLTEKRGDSYLEHVVESEFVGVLEEAGWETLKGDKIKRGWSDQFCFGPGPVTVIVELKRLEAPKKRRGEKLQDHYRAVFRNMGFRTHKVTGLAEAYALADDLIKEFSRWA